MHVLSRYTLPYLGINDVTQNSSGCIFISLFDGIIYDAIEQFDNCFCVTIALIRQHPTEQLTEFQENLQIFEGHILIYSRKCSNVSRIICSSQ